MAGQPKRRPWIVGNWKMHGLRASLSALLDIDTAARECGAVDVAVALPFTLMYAGTQSVKQIAIGAQTCHAQPQGAHTGDISAAMLCDSGAEFVIVGHSERRLDCAETDDIVRNKLHAVLSFGLTAILCVGESHAEREAGVAEKRVREQLDHALSGLAPSPGLGQRLAIAYEPIWAIGTGLVPEAAVIAATHAALRESITKTLGAYAEPVRLLYGGSVHEGNARTILSLADVDGALVGSASLDPRRFSSIISTAQETCNRKMIDQISVADEAALLH